MITKEKLKEYFKKALCFIFNPRLLLCFGIAWFVTNGWSYVLFLLGTLFRSTWMIAISSAYLAALWTPFTPEKIITVIIAIWLLRLIFPKDDKTLALLYEMRDSIKNKIARRKARRKAQKRAEEQERETKRLSAEESRASDKTD